MKKTLEDYEAEKKRLKKRLEQINNKIEEFKKPKPVGFNYPGKQ